MKITHPANLDCVTFGECKGYLIKWKKSTIELYATSSHPCQPPASRVTPTGPSPIGISSAQTYENYGANGAGGDMVIDKELLIGDTLPPHHPITKTKPSTSGVPEKGCGSPIDGLAMAINNRKNRIS
jgi:hypothetical protein